MNDIPSKLPGGDVKIPHSIYIPEEKLSERIPSEEYITISLRVKGVVSVFYTSIPTQCAF